MASSFPSGSLRFRVREWRYRQRLRLDSRVLPLSSPAPTDPRLACLIHPIAHPARVRRPIRARPSRGHLLERIVERRVESPGQTPAGREPSATELALANPCSRPLRRRALTRSITNLAPISGRAGTDLDGAMTNQVNGSSWSFLHLRPIDFPPRQVLPSRTCARRVQTELFVVRCQRKRAGP